MTDKEVVQEVIEEGAPGNVSENETSPPAAATDAIKKELSESSEDAPNSEPVVENKEVNNEEGRIPDAKEGEEETRLNPANDGEVAAESSGNVTAESAKTSPPPSTNVPESPERLMESPPPLEDLNLDDDEDDKIGDTIQYLSDDENSQVEGRTTEQSRVAEQPSVS